MEEAGRRNRDDMFDRVVVGYDLGETYAQISYCQLWKKEPETISTVTGEEQFNIPAALWMNLAGNQWYYGKEAVKRREDASGLYLDHLLSAAYAGEDVVLDQKPFGATALLALFVKRSISLLSSVTKLDRIAGFLFTVDKLDERMAQVLAEVSETLNLKDVEFFCQSRAESFYAYNLYQPKELWNHQVLLCDLSEDYLKLFRLYSNKKTKPEASFVERLDYPEFAKREDMTGQDAAFLTLLQQACGDRLLSSVYLIGDGFRQDWYKESLRFLCRGRRVFLGNNLYSKGACYACTEKFTLSEESKNHVYLGEDKLKANIGMKGSRRGDDSYFAILNAGCTWYEARREFEFLLEEGNRFSLLVAPLYTPAVKEVVVTLTGLPERPPRTSRIHLEISLKAVDRIHLTMEDLGFGDFYPSSRRIWQEEFSLDEL